MFPKYLKNRKKYMGSDRSPSFKLAGEYIQKVNGGTIVDLGCGHGDLSEYLGMTDSIFHVDGNPTTIKLLKKKGFSNIVEYRAPSDLPFNDRSIDLIHCSHMIEHLNNQTLYILLQEIDRILKPEGYFIVGAPYLYPGFYEEITHINPYMPGTVLSMLTDQGQRDLSSPQISSNYSQKELIFRWNVQNYGEGYQANNIVMNFLLFGWKVFLSKIMGLRKYRIIGWLLVLQKQEVQG
jgi:SAM-dependent methyltransferase